ncbi:MAG: universal stress protein [Hyphomonadaceae bacterium]|nr:universal stress protein [Hyphomonadaceae bacterium]
MSHKSILAVASGSDEDAHVLNVAAGLARESGAETRVAPAFPDPAADLVYYGAAMQRGIDEGIMERIRASERDAQARLERMARQASEEADLASEIRVEPRSLSPAATVAAAVALSDLVVFGAHAARRAALLADLFAETLLQARASVLLVKGGPWKSDTAAIAWDGSAQAGRAVRAAMPILQRARSVRILTNADDAEGIASIVEPDDLQAYLALHGVANAKTSAVRGGDVAASLLDAAMAAEASLLVAGAYGRPRVFELVLGGTTRALVNAEGGPHLLLAH